MGKEVEVKVNCEEKSLLKVLKQWSRFCWFLCLLLLARNRFYMISLK